MALEGIKVTGFCLGRSRSVVRTTTMDCCQKDAV